VGRGAPPDLRRFLAAEAERRPGSVEPGAPDRRAQDLFRFGF
jgi:hypothetical protein